MSYTTRPSRMPLVALGVVVIVLAAAFGFYYFQTSGTISGLSQTVSSQSSQIQSQSSQVQSQSSQIQSQAAQIASDNAKITNLTSTVSALQSHVSTLQSQVSSLKSQVGSLTAKDAQANQTIATITSQISTLNNQISTLNSQIATDQSQISSLQGQVTSLQAISNLSDSTQEVASQSFNTGTMGNVTVVSFTANYAGYVLVSVSSASDYANEGPQVQISFASSVQGNYGNMYIPGNVAGYFTPFSSVPDAVPIPVTPGTITVYLGTSDTSAQTATLSVIYYY